MAVFLDCDGVLCCSRSVSYDYTEGDPTLCWSTTNNGKEDCDDDNNSPPLERRCLDNLKTILVDGRATHLVLTTTWRLDPELRAHLVDILRKEVLVGECIAVLGEDTPSLPGCGRGMEVQQWLEMHPDLAVHDVREGVVDGGSGGSGIGREGVVGGGGGGSGETDAGLTRRRFVVLDDEHTESFAAALPAGHVVKTLMYVPDDPAAEGITEAAVTRAVMILNPQ